MTRDEYQLQNQMTSTAREAGYHANAAISDTDEASLASAAQDFAAASAADRSAFEQLTTTNGDLSSQVANMAVQNQHLQQQMSQMQQHMMCMASAPAPPPAAAYSPHGRGSRGCGHHCQPNQQRQRPRQQPPSHMQAPYGMPQPPYGGAPVFPPGQPPAPYTPHSAPPAPYMPPAPPANPYSAAPPGFGQYQPPPNGNYNPRQQPYYAPTTKRYNNLNYCWTHGGDIDDSLSTTIPTVPSAPSHQIQHHGRQPERHQQGLHWHLTGRGGATVSIK
jgi:hypothetical protein